MGGGGREDNTHTHIRTCARTTACGRDTKQNGCIPHHIVRGGGGYLFARWWTAHAHHHTYPDGVTFFLCFPQYCTADHPTFVNLLRHLQQHTCQYKWHTYSTHLNLEKAISPRHP